MSYTTIKIPSSFCEKYIDSLVDDSENGFTSRADLVKTAIRAYYSEQKEQEKKLK